MKFGIEFEHNSRQQDPVPSFAVTVTWPHRIKGWGWGWKCKVWRWFYGAI